MIPGLFGTNGDIARVKKFYNSFHSDPAYTTFNTVILKHSPASLPPPCSTCATHRPNENRTEHPACLPARFLHPFAGTRSLPPIDFSFSTRIRNAPRPHRYQATSLERLLILVPHPLSCHQEATSARRTTNYRRTIDICAIPPYGNRRARSSPPPH